MVDVRPRCSRPDHPAGVAGRARAALRYNVLGQLVALDVAGDTWRFEYDTAGRLTRSIDPTGRASRFDYDVAGRMVESRGLPRHAGPLRLRRRAAASPRWSTPTAARCATSTTPLNQLTSITDQLGRQTIVDYDAAGRHVVDHVSRPAPPAAPSILDRSSSPVDGADADRPRRPASSRSATTLGDGMVTTWTLPDGDQHRAEARRRRARRAAHLAGLRPHVDPRHLRAGHHGRRRPSTALPRRRRRCAATPPDAWSSRTSTAQSPRSATTVPGSSSSRSDSARAVERGSTTSSAACVGSARRDGERRFRYDDAHQLVELTDAGGARTTFEYDARGRRVRASGGARHHLRLGRVRTSRPSSSTASCAASTPMPTGALRRAGDIERRMGHRSVATAPDVDRRRSASSPSIPATFAHGRLTSRRCDWRPFKLADAWGGVVRSRRVAGTTYFGVEADGLVWLGARPYDVADPPVPRSRPAGAGARAAGLDVAVHVRRQRPDQPLRPDRPSADLDRGVQRHPRPAHRPAVAEHRHGGDRRRGRRRHGRHARHGRSRGDGARRRGDRRRRRRARRERRREGLESGHEPRRRRVQRRDDHPRRRGRRPRWCPRRRPRRRRQRPDDEHQVGRQHRRPAARRRGAARCSPKAPREPPRESSARPTT